MRDESLSPPLDAALFDMDGVVTDTADAHAAAWKRLFDAYLSKRAEKPGTDFVPFDMEHDYRRFVDGMPRYDGVKTFLQSRGIELPFGGPDDAPDRESICGLGNRKDQFFQEWLQSHPVRTYPGTLALLERMRGCGIKLGVFSASRNAGEVLKRAEVLDMFDARFDGTDLARLGLPGKPEPAMLNALAKQLGVAPSHAAVVEDAVAGVQAAVRGGFGFVVGIDRGHYAEALALNGASIVVGDAGELRLGEDRRLGARTIDNVPSVQDHWSEIAARVRAAEPAVFLDYDGTLTPIVPDPDQALLDSKTREALAMLSERVPVTIVSGRDLRKLHEFVGLESIYYVASHGFELAGPGGSHQVVEGAQAYEAELDRAERALGVALKDIAGYSIERKAFAMAVHFRRVADADVVTVERAVHGVLAAHPRLRMGGGKKVFELLPAIRWNKGEAVSSLVEKLGLDSDKVLPIYVGDDLTDEDAFRILGTRGIGVVVRDGARRTSAGYGLAGPEEVRAFLMRLATLLDGSAS
jgi:alpha,alpha-trehalase